MLQCLGVKSMLKNSPWGENPFPSYTPKPRRPQFRWNKVPTTKNRINSTSTIDSGWTFTWPRKLGESFPNRFYGKSNMGRFNGAKLDWINSFLLVSRSADWKKLCRHLKWECIECIEGKSHSTSIGVSFGLFCIHFNPFLCKPTGFTKLWMCKKSYYFPIFFLLFLNIEIGLMKLKRWKLNEMDR